MSWSNYFSTIARVSLWSGALGYASAKIFGITDNPKAASVFSISKTAIAHIITFGGGYACALLGTPASGLKNVEDHVVQATSALIGMVLIYPCVALPVSIVAGRYIANQLTTPDKKLTYRQVCKLTVAEWSAEVALNTYVAPAFRNAR